MTDEKNTKLLFLGIYPKCPFYKPLPVLIILVLISFGTWGIYYFNLWVAIIYLIYSMVFYFLLMPFTMCKYCYFKVKETMEDDKSSVENWAKTGLQLHVGQKHWAWPMFVIWVLPIALAVISFFINFSMFAVIALVGFIAMVTGNYLFMVRVKCPKCPIREECHSSF